MLEMHLLDDATVSKLGPWLALTRQSTKYAALSFRGNPITSPGRRQFSIPELWAMGLFEMPPA